MYVTITILIRSTQLGVKTPLQDFVFLVETDLARFKAKNLYNEAPSIELILV